MTATADISERLAFSRERMREALRGRPPSRSGEASGEAAAGRSVSWFDQLTSLPMASIVIDAVSGWWARHPLRVAVVVGTNAAKALAQPIAERNPLGLVLGSAVLGAVVVWSRPWRWLLKPALFAGLLPQLLTQALAHLPSQASAVSPPARAGHEPGQSSSNGSNNA